MPDRTNRTPDSAPAGTAHPGFFSGLTRRLKRALAAGVVLAGCGFALVAASQSRPELTAGRFGLAPQPPEPQATADLNQLSGFQRRGNSLVGEVVTRDGTAMRLVFDARTQALIGLRVLARAPSIPHEPRACAVAAPSTPLPEAVTPAN